MVSKEISASHLKIVLPQKSLELGQNDDDVKEISGEDEETDWGDDILQAHKEIVTGLGIDEKYSKATAKTKAIRIVEVPKIRNINIENLQETPANLGHPEDAKRNDSNNPRLAI
jgi:hypothetical protein